MGYAFIYIQLHTIIDSYNKLYLFKNGCDKVSHTPQRSQSFMANLE